jgi:hypothetical protein
MPFYVIVVPFTRPNLSMQKAWMSVRYLELVRVNDLEPEKFKKVLRYRLRGRLKPVSNSKPILKEMGETIDEMSNHIQSYAHDLGRVFRSLYRTVQACTPISNMA